MKSFIRVARTNRLPAGEANAEVFNAVFRMTENPQFIEISESVKSEYWIKDGFLIVRSEVADEFGEVTEFYVGWASEVEKTKANPDVDSRTKEIINIIETR